MKFKSIAILTVALCSFLSAPRPTHAQTILSNIPGSGAYVPATSFASGFSKAVGITIGPTDLIFQSLDAIISNIGAQNMTFLVGGIHSDAAGNPGSLLAAFDVVFLPAGLDNVTVTFTTPTPFTLQAGTSYWFRLDDAFGDQPVDWQRDTANTAPTATGITWNGYRLTTNGGSSWTASSSYNSVRIIAAPVPEPATWLTLALGATLLAATLRARR